MQKPIARIAAPSTTAPPPVVEIVDDPRGLEAANPTVELHYRVRTPSGRPVDRIEVRIDGQLGSARAATEADGTGDGANIMVIPVPAQNGEISLVAYHGSHHAPATIPLLWRGAAPKKVERHLRALLVGVSQYENPSLKLNYAAKDAQDLAAVLQNMQGHYFKTVETKLLLNADATEDNIETALLILPPHPARMTTPWSSWPDMVPRGRTASYSCRKRPILQRTAWLQPPCAAR